MSYANPEDRKRRRREWYKENKEHRRKYLKEWAKRNPESRKRASLKYSPKWRDNNRAKWMKIITFLGMDKCSICGYDKCFRAIDFHHRNPNEKERNPGREMHYAVSIARVMEFDKCISVCSNCHREIHDNWVKNGLQG